jgi:hypothetical protein
MFRPEVSKDGNMRFLKTAVILSIIAFSAPSQDAANTDIDPLAMQVLRATTDTLKSASAFSFRAVVSRERLGSNDEVLTFVHQSEVTIARPDKLRMQASGGQHKIDVYFNKGDAVVYSPGNKLYAHVGASQTLDDAVDKLEDKSIQIPMSPLLRSDPYKVLADGLLRAAIIGRVDIGGKTYHHLVFTEKEAEWQIWVEGGGKPTLPRVQIVYKTLPREPRVTIDFHDWNLSAKPAASDFVFHKPDDAKAIEFMEARGGDKK